MSVFPINRITAHTFEKTVRFRKWHANQVPLPKGDETCSQG